LYDSHNAYPSFCSLIDGVDASLASVTRVAQQGNEDAQGPNARFMRHTGAPLNSGLIVRPQLRRIAGLLHLQTLQHFLHSLVNSALSSTLSYPLLIGSQVHVAPGTFTEQASPLYPPTHHGRPTTDNMEEAHPRAFLDCANMHNDSYHCSICIHATDPE